jgi:hypothetical protein
MASGLTWSAVGAQDPGVGWCSCLFAHKCSCTCLLQLEARGKRPKPFDASTQSCWHSLIVEC